VAKQLDRQLGYWSVVSISVGAMLGSGIFVLPGLAAAIAGPWVGLSYVLAGIMVLPAVASKAELATAMPVAGGTYTYIDRAMGPWMGTITGLGTWFSLSAKTSFALVGLGAYIIILGGEEAVELVKPISMGILAFLTLVNIVGVGKASTLQTIIVSICVVALALFGIFGISTAEPEHFVNPFPEGPKSIVAGAAFVFVSYAGVTKICSVAEEVRNPGKNIPSGMFTAHFSVMAIYAAIATVIVANVSTGELHTTNTPIALAAENISAGVTGVLGGGRAGLVLMSIVSILGLVSMSNAGLLAASRDPYAMSRDSVLPSRIQQLSPRFATPVVAILLTSGLLFTLVYWLPVVKLAKLASAFKIVVFALVNLAVILLRESHAHWYRPSYKAPFYPWIQLFGIAGAVALLTTLSFFAVAGVLTAVLVGTGWYFGYVARRINRKSVLRHLWGDARLLRETLKAERDEDNPGTTGRVVVPLFGQEAQPERLIRMGASLLERGELETLRLEELPEQTKLTGLSAPDAQSLALGALVVDISQDLQIKASFHDILTHNAKRAVQDHAEATAADWLVMEWPQSRSISSLVSNPMSWWLDHTPSDLALFLDRGETVFRRILVLAKPGPYDSLMMHVADRLASAHGGSVTLLRPVKKATTQDQIDGQRAYHEELSRMCRAPSESLILRSENDVSLVAEISADYDLLILGGNPEGLLRTLIFGSEEHGIAAAVTCSVLKVKTPRHKVHPRFSPAPRSDFDFDNLDTFISWAAVEQNLQVQRKEELFQAIGKRIADVVGLDLGPAIAHKIARRDRRQTTQLPGGVALIGTTKTGLPATTLGIFTTSDPLAWSGPYPDPVDVVIVVASPPGDRQVQLWMLGRLARIILLSEFLDGIRATETREDLLNFLRVSDQALDSFFTSGEITQPELPRVVLPEETSIGPSEPDPEDV